MDVLEAIRRRASTRAYLDQPVNRATVEADARRIAALYSDGSRFGAEVRPTIIQREDGRVNLVFEVIEGRIDSVDGVNFVGNSRFTDARLRRAVRSREGGALGWLLTSDNFSVGDMRGDEDALLNF